MTPNSAIVLPANTTLLDDCADDNSTVRGAFFCEKFPEEIDSLPSLFKTILDSTGINPASEGQYPPGTTIILPDRFSNPARVLVTVSAIHFPNPVFSVIRKLFQVVWKESFALLPTKASIQSMCRY
jgi:hypothetical protein